jgi:tetratricopeptide (TPR) repeat protein
MIRYLTAAVALRPQSPGARNNLGVALREKGALDEAIAAFREAIRLKNDYVEACSNLGSALKDKGQLDEAIATYQEALRIKKDFAAAYNNLGNALQAKRKGGEAIAAYQEAIRLKQNFAEAHNNLGYVLRRNGQMDKAIAEFRAALRIKNENAEAHYNLALALQDQGRLEEAINEYQEGNRFKKDDPIAHFYLGNALKARGRLEEAISAYQEAIRINKDYAEAHCNLGQVLLRQGRFRQGAEELRRGHELGSRNPRWPYPSSQWVRKAERLAELDAHLPRFLQGQEQPADAEDCLALALLCQQYKQRYAAASRWYAEAFVSDPKLATELGSGHRYNAACAGALAGCGQGQDAASLGDQERTRLRGQALEWLQADLEAWRRALEKEPDKVRPIVVQKMQHWLADTDFTGVRGEALARLPEAERRDWQRLWREVEDLRRRVVGSPNTATPAQP